MTASPTYVLDTNVLVEAAQRYYAFDIDQRFWQVLIELAESGQVVSIDRVKEEIARGKDELATWANGSFQWFVSTAQSDVIGAYRQIMVWAQGSNQFTPAAKAEFASDDNADGWVVAYAKAKGCVVVTHERFDQNIKRTVKIPNVCQAFRVQYVDTFQMLRDLGVRLG